MMARAGAGGDQGGGDGKSERSESAHRSLRATNNDEQRMRIVIVLPYLKVTPRPKWKRVLPLRDRATSSDTLTRVRCR